MMEVSESNDELIAYVLAELEAKRWLAEGRNRQVKTVWDDEQRKRGMTIFLYERDRLVGSVKVMTEHEALLNI